MAPADLWYCLSGDILHSIAAATNYLHALTLLRSVCASWRSSIDKPSFSSSSLPLSFPFPIISVVDLNYNPPPHCYFKLTHNTLYFLTPPAGRGSSWLLRVQEPPIQNHDGSITYHPLSPLSKSEPLEKVPESINLLDVAIAEVGRAHCLKVVNYDDEERKARKKKLERAEAQGKYLPRSIADIADYFLTFVKKVALSPPDHGVIAVVIVLAGRLCSFNLGAGNGQWAYLDPHNEHYHDVVHRKGKFFVVDYRGSTVVIDGADLQKEEVKLTRLVENPFPVDRERFQFTRLVESGDELLLIDRHALLNGLVMLGMITEECHPPMEENYFQVYRLDEVEKRWEPVNDLGHKVLLLGDDYVFSVDARDFTGLRGNCIYFSDIGFIKRNQKKAGIGKSCVRMGVYDLRDRRCGPLAEFPDHWPVFAPPPAWLKPKCRGGIMKEGMKEKYLRRDVTTSQQDVPKPSAKAKKKAAEAKVRGDDAYRSKDYLGALDAYTQAIDFDPSDATLLSNRSICWIRLGQAKHALTDAKSCRALRPDWAKACYREGAALQLLQRFDEAANSFKEGLDLDPDSKDLANAFRFPPMWIIATFSPRLENLRSSLGISMPELRAPPIPPLPRLLQDLSLKRIFGKRA